MKTLSSRKQFVKPYRIQLTLLAMFLMLAGVVALLITPVQAQVVGQQPTVLGGNVPVVVTNLQPVGNLPASENLNFVIELTLHNQAGFNTLLQQIYDPTSPNYHHYLTPDQFTAQFGPSEQDYQAVIAFVQSNGFTITGTHTSRMLLDVSAPVTNIESAFHVNMLVYQHPTENRTFYAPDTNPSVDAGVPIQDVIGLENYESPHPQVGSGGSYTLSGDDLGYFTGSDYRNVYVPGTSLTGAGQSVGLIEFDSDYNGSGTDGYHYYTNDVRSYETNAGLPFVPIQEVQVSDGFSGEPAIYNFSSDLEIAMDIEVSVSMAPGLSNVVVFEALSHTSTAFVNALDAIASYPTNANLHQVSISWSGFPITETLFQTLAAEGISVFVASGDDINTTNTAGYPLITYPSDSTNVTSVGGTTLTTPSTGNSGTTVSWSNEVAWYYAWSTPSPPGTNGSVGGISSTFSLPSWQAGLNQLANTNSGVSSTMRNVPDVSMVAQSIIVYTDSGIYVGSGTSASAPLWAGFTALANQQAAQNGKNPVGFLNPALYSLGNSANYAQCFHDVTSGNAVNFAGKGYSAYSGYDLCTGWGTPNGTNLINALLRDAPTNLPTTLSSTNFSFTITDMPTDYLDVYSSTDLVAWTWIAEVTNTSGTVVFNDNTISGIPYRFYYTDNARCSQPVGFVRLTIPGNTGPYLGFKLIADQLYAPTNTLNGLFNPMFDGTYLPSGSQIQTWNGSSYVTNTWSSGAWSPNGNAALLPGGGAFIVNSSTNPITVSFAGLVPEGSLTNQLTNQITSGYEIYSSMIPKAGALDATLGYTPSVGDEVERWNGTNFSMNSYLRPKGGGSPSWTPDDPVVNVGESYFIITSTNNTWETYYSPCQ